MLHRKLVLLIFIFLFSIIPVFSIGLYDDYGNFVYYVSNPTPQINVTIDSMAEPVNVTTANLEINSVAKSTLVNKILNPGTSNTFSFSFDDFDFNTTLSENDEAKFNLEILSGDGLDAKTKGDPTNFDIRLDLKVPEITLPRPGKNIQLFEESAKLTLNFNERIIYYKAVVGSRVVKEETYSGSYIRDYNKIVDIFLTEEMLEEGGNTLTITFRDLAGNTNSQSYLVSYRGADLDLSLVTRKEETGLKYYYNTEYLNFFNGTIYTSEEEFSMKVRTTKKAKCYYANNMLNFDTFNNALLKTETSSSDGYTHTFNVDTKTTSKIWVACRNVAYIDDVVYLNDVLGLKNSLVKVKKYNGDIEITEVFPDSLLTSIPFNIDVSTNVKAVCDYTFANGAKNKLETNGYYKHYKRDISSQTGTFNLQVSCMDLLGEVDLVSKSLEIDPSKGVTVTNYEPMYIEKSSATLSLTLSEDAFCKYSLKQERTDDFLTLKNMSGNGLSRGFSVSGLSVGDNYVYVYCQKLQVVNQNTLKIIYDSIGPKIENLTFTNFGIKSDYVGSTSEIGLYFDVASLIPINMYYVEVEFENESKNFTVESNDVVINDDFNGANSVKVIAQNMLGTLSSAAEKLIRFDTEAPKVTVTLQGDKAIITCFDAKSGCYETMYGFSKTGIDCQVTKTYSLNESVLFEGKNYICAQSRDYAGNTQKELKALVLGFEFEEDDFENVSFEDFEEEEVEVEEEPDVDPFIPDTNIPVDSGGGTGAVVAASLVLFVAALGGGGYYAYRKGYLNEQLEKMGILKRGSSTQSSTFSNVKNSVVNKVKSVAKREDKSKKYDDHLKKLNSFIDDTIDRRKNVFEGFASSGKGKVKNYDDTLNKKNDDEFYKAKKSVNNSNDIKSEAEDFEEFHKKKQSDKKD